MDTFKNYNSSLESPARCATDVAPSDTSALSQVTRAIYVGEAGDISVEMVDGANVTFQAVPSGTVLPIRVSKIRATGTTAGALLGLW